MFYAPFSEYFPKIAEEETRVITILPDTNQLLPVGQYVFLEMFCNEPDCDCRRVFFYVISTNPKKPDAIIAYGWENSSFYAKWMGSNNPKTIAKLKGPALNFGSPQSRLAPAILKLTKQVLLQDPAYLRRLKRHYQMYRDKIDTMSDMKKRKKRSFFQSKGFGGLLEKL